MRKSLPTRGTVGAAAVALTLALAPGPAAAPTAPTCSDEKSHQFDFWIGEWNVFADDRKAGVNSIRPILDGCVLQEVWSGSGGSAGSSFNFYNPRTGKWHQFWVRRNGTTLNLSGAYEDGKMILSGESVDREGKEVRNRVTWSDNPDGTVRQHWQQSKDDGKSWSTVFDGLYKRRG